MSAKPRVGSPRSEPLSRHLRPFFWDCDFRHLSLDSHTDFIVGRLLAEGDWDSIRWLRRRVGDRALRGWFNRRSGAGLSPRTLRFWGLVLRLDRSKVDTWIAQQRENPWHRRTGQ
jgi:hypothetical protein